MECATVSVALWIGGLESPPSYKLHAVTKRRINAPHSQRAFGSILLKTGHICQKTSITAAYYVAKKQVIQVNHFALSEINSIFLSKSPMRVPGEILARRIDWYETIALSG